jgi:hypothetical protein
MSCGTPIKDRHPGRIICIHGETSRDIVLEVQRSLQSSSSRIQIHVEHCTRDRLKSISLRSASTTGSMYVKTFNEIKDSLKELCEKARRLGLWLRDEIEIHPNFQICNVSSSIKKQSPDLSARTPAEVSFPRLGAFEVIVFIQSNTSQTAAASQSSKWKEILIYSKLYTKRWPDVSKLSTWIESLMIDGGPARSSLVIQRAFRAHRARRSLSIQRKTKYAKSAAVLQAMMRREVSRRWQVAQSQAISVLRKTYRGHLCRRRLW